MPTKQPIPFYQVVGRANPLAGAELQLTAPGQGLWRVISLAATFVASAAAANRRVVLLADDNTDVWFAAQATVDVTAGLTARVGAYAGAQGTGAVAGALNIALPSEGLVLLPGHRLRTVTANIDVGDQYSAIRALVQEFPFGPEAEYLPGIATQVSPMG